jgi:para-nitrobenzyl esterase
VSDKIVTSEDCLTLNITSPSTTGKRPVIVWIHGGAFVMGSGSTPLYDGTSFAVAHDLVVVTINYRLGLLGFLYTGDAGNVALLDQALALAWVRDNIAAFGGDPAQVTIMGESAGAISVALLLAMPAARGLFHRAILQSGAVQMSMPTRADAEALAKDAIAELPLDAPVERIVALQERLIQDKGLAAVAPYVDGHTIPRAPLAMIDEGSAPGVPVLVGTNRDEWKLFTLFLGEASARVLEPRLRERLGAAAFDELVALYAGDWTRITGDIAFRIPAIRLAEAQLRHAHVHMYRFDFASTSFGGQLGAAHALEIPFVWNALTAAAAPILLGDAIAVALPLAERMHAAWASFVRTGDPGWPRYDLERRATMLFDRDSRIADDPDGVSRAWWDGKYR